jgi:hypothetical protein
MTSTSTSTSTSTLPYYHEQHTVSVEQLAMYQYLYAIASGGTIDDVKPVAVNAVATNNVSSGSNRPSSTISGNNNNNEANLVMKAAATNVGSERQSHTDSTVTGKTASRRTHGKLNSTASTNTAAGKVYMDISDGDNNHTMTDVSAQVLTSVANIRGYVTGKAVRNFSIAHPGDNKRLGGKVTGVNTEGIRTLIMTEVEQGVGERGAVKKEDEGALQSAEKEVEKEEIEGEIDEVKEAEEEVVEEEVWLSSWSESRLWIPLLFLAMWDQVRREDDA